MLRRVPASSGQASLWFLRQIMPCKAPYNTAVGVRLSGEIDAGALVAAVREVARRHESFRTTFAVEDGKVMQVISDLPAADAAVVDVTGAAAPEAEAERVAREAAATAFDLARGPLLRVRIVRIGPREALLCAVMDHIVADGLSLGILWREIEGLYPAFREGLPSPLPPPEKQFSACVEAQRRWMETPAFAKQLGWWRDRLAGAVACDLPADRPRPPVKSYEGGFVRRPFPRDLAARLRALADRLDASLFAVLLSGLFTLLARASGQRDLVLMIPVACRQRFDAGQVIGFLSNMIVIRVSVPDRVQFRALVQRVGAEVMAGVLRQDVPFEKVVEALRPDRSLAHDPLARIALSFLPAQGATLSLPGVQAAYDEIPNGGAKFDLHVTIAERGDGTATCIAEYNRDVYDADTIVGLLDRYHRLLEGAASDPDRAVADLPLLGEEERRRLVVECNRTEVALPREASLPDLVRAAAARTPGAPAATFEGQEIRYDALCRRSAQVARSLRARGVAPGERVGVALDRSLDMLAGLLGILEAGAAYVPIDPLYPPARVATMAEDAGLAAVVTERRFAALFPAPGRGLLLFDEDAAEIAAQDDAPVGVSVHPEQIAYVIYTSGSTGRPKGVEVPHRALVNFLTSMAACPGLGPGDRLLAVTSLSFDIAGLEIWLPLVVGAHVEIASRRTALDGAALRRVLDAGRITVLQATPSTFHLLYAAGWEPSAGLRVLVGGEAVPRDLASAMVRRAASVWNMYGPTETTVWSTVERLDAGDGPVTVGRPIANTQVYVLDAGLEPKPPGVPGELYIGGAGVARGYLGRPDLTAERFIPHPFVEGERVYRTGDLARFRRDGALELLGRLDHQVKIRGHRIELGEIEAALVEHPAVARAVAVAREVAPGDVRLVAYVVPATSPLETPSALRAHLASKLPEHMVPAAIVAIDAVPILPNGKIDRDALPAPCDASAEEGAFAAPRTPVEGVLAGIWADVLGIERVGVQDDFFALGGHSLLGMRVLARVAAALGVDLPMRALFEARTVADLAVRVAGARAEAVDRARAIPPLVALPRAGALPLSFAQQRLWFLDRLEPAASAAYSMPSAVRVVGPLDVAALAQSVLQIVRRHEALRTTFVEVGGEPRQVIAPAPASSPLEIVDLTALPVDAREAAALLRAGAEAQRPFDLARGPFFRALLVRLSDRDHVLVLSMHHIVSDGWSEGVLGCEISALYAASTAGLPSPLPELSVQAADHAVWQRAWLTGDALRGRLAYWERALQGAPAALELPADRARPPLQSYTGATSPWALGREAAALLGVLARREGVTLFMVLLAGFQILLSRYTGQDDVVVGSPAAGRTPPETEGVIGFFVNTLVLRTDLRGDPTVRALLARVRDVTLDAYAHQEVPFEKLVEALAPPRDLSRSPLFQVMLILQNAPPAPLALGEATVTRLDLERGTSKVDLTLWLEEGPEGVAGFLEYPTALFDAPTIVRMGEHLRTLLDAMAAGPSRRVSALPMLPPAELREIIATWNETGRPNRQDECVHELVEAQAAARPGATAIAHEGRTLAYAELDARADRLAHRLIARGAGPGALVGISMDRSIGMVVGLYAILKSGAAYVPLDPTYPKDRIAFVMEDAGIELLVTDAPSRERLPPHRAEVVLLDAEGEEIASGGGPLGAGAGPRAAPGDRAYVIYTSGSTGQPKGVEIPHRAVVNFLASMAEKPGLGPEDRVLAVTSLSFDIAGLELWLPLTVGAVVEIAGRATAGDGAALRRILEAGGITTLQATPSTFRLLLEAGWAGDGRLRVLVGGEAVPRDLADRLLDRAGSVWNVYGPTETTVWSTLQQLEKGAPVLIGRPIANTRVHVLDRHLSPVPAGVTGELYIGGTGLGRGYLGRPELTAERFVPDPFSAGERLYRTGDLCRFRRDGALEFLGRADFQIKLRGHRIELGEIEATLARHPAVREAIVTAYEDAPGDQRLAAYVTAREGGAAPSAADLRAHLRASLPEYMVPGRFVALDRMPLTRNGKIDRKALPKPERGFAVAAEGEAPADEELTLKLRMVWEEVLRIRGIGLHDSFWDLGGHSLLALTLFDRMEQALGVELPVAALFAAPTIGDLAALLRREGWKPSWSCLVPIQTSGDKPPFFCVHAVGGNVLNYRRLAFWLGNDQPFYGLMSRGLGGDEAPHDTIEEMAAAYLAEIRAVQPRGPYRLGGASSGGAIAYEMAQQLRASGEEVAALVMMDTAIVGPPPERVAEMRTRSRLHGRGVKVDYHLGNLLLRTPREGARYLASKAEARFKGENVPAVKAINAAPPIVRAVYLHTLRALEAYTPRPYSGSATMLLSCAEPYRTFYDVRLGWADLVQGGLVVRFVPGEHETMLDEPHVAEVAAVLAHCLR